jgi:RNA polymerase sigma-70 factor (ECF subfamily)
VNFRPPDSSSCDSAAMANARARDFELQHGRHLRALAYRMLGSRADAQDIVQDAWLRWTEVDPGKVDNDRAFLSRTVTNLCLDRIGSAQARKEHYVGMWLPEPLVDDAQDWSPDPQDATEFAQDVSVAFMLTLRRLGPVERAAFLLHDVFDLGYDEVGRHLQRSEQACRQLVSRARSRVKGEYARCQVEEEERQRLLYAFAQALVAGDVETLASVLAHDAILITDGGGLATAIPQALHGGGRIAKALVGFNKSVDTSVLRYRTAMVNGLPGYVLYTQDGAPLQAVALSPAGKESPGRLQAVYIIRNPRKLQHLAASSGDSAPMPAHTPAALADTDRKQ